MFGLVFSDGPFYKLCAPLSCSKSQFAAVRSRSSYVVVTVRKCYCARLAILLVLSIQWDSLLLLFPAAIVNVQQMRLCCKSRCCNTSTNVHSSAAPAVSAILFGPMLSAAAFCALVAGYSITLLIHINADLQCCVLAVIDTIFA